MNPIILVLKRIISINNEIYIVVEQSDKNFDTFLDIRRKKCIQNPALYFSLKQNDDPIFSQKGHYNIILPINLLNFLKVLDNSVFSESFKYLAKYLHLSKIINFCLNRHCEDLWKLNTMSLKEEIISTIEKRKYILNELLNNLEKIPFSKIGVKKEILEEIQNGVTKLLDERIKMYEKKYIISEISQIEKNLSNFSVFLKNL